jgi:hypothetical protein
VAIRIAVGFASDHEVEMLHVVLLDEAVLRQQRIVSFGVDDRAAAITELDRLHAAINA